MKRDLDLVRKILLEMEKAPPGDDFVPINFEDYDRMIVQEHLRLLQENGQIEALVLRGDDTFEVHPQRLTWEGHNFLQHIRDEHVFHKAMSAIGTNAAALSFSILRTRLMEEAQKLLENSPFNL